jgi:hypothetical protein
MNVSLTPELEELTNEKVKTGLYQTAVAAGARLTIARSVNQRPPPKCFLSFTGTSWSTGGEPPHATALHVCRDCLTIRA